MPTIVLEVICDGELWIWHHSFRLPESLDNINFFDCLTTVAGITDGTFSISIKVHC